MLVQHGHDRCAGGPRRAPGRIRQPRVPRRAGPDRARGRVPPDCRRPQRHLPARPDRTITITLLYPARGEPGNDHAEHIGVVGHSLGAITTIGVTFNSCCHDTRVDAAVEISGIELPFPNGDYANRPATPPLAVHGARDTTIPVVGSDQLVAQARPPAYYLRLPDGDHLSLLDGDSGVLVDETVIAFLDRYLAGDPEPLNHIPARVRRSELATFDAHTSEQP